jgi:hypothetical protein
VEKTDKFDIRIKLYDELLKEHKRRKMTSFSESLKAFSAIIPGLCAGFGIQFVWGLPNEGYHTLLGGAAAYREQSEWQPISVPRHQRGRICRKRSKNIF